MVDGVGLTILEFAETVILESAAVSGRWRRFNREREGRARLPADWQNWHGCADHVILESHPQQLPGDHHGADNLGGEYRRVRRASSACWRWRCGDNGAGCGDQRCHLLRQRFHVWEERPPTHRRLPMLGGSADSRRIPIRTAGPPPAPITCMRAPRHTVRSRAASWSRTPPTCVHGGLAAD